MRQPAKEDSVITTAKDVSLEIRVGRAQASDHAALEAMYAAFEPKAEALGLPPLHAEDTARWLEGLSSFPNFLAWEGDRVVGHGAVCADGDSAEVAVFVHQDFRGRGIGRRLLNELIAEAQRLGLRRVWGIAAPDNIPMLRLAYSCGFIPGDEMGEFYRILP
jgi:GNAT superfamily N-acetyltransferase